MAGPASVRIILDEDLPRDLADHLRARGFDCFAIEELRESVWGGLHRITDELVCEEIARLPSVLVTMNVRDYADQAFLQQIVEEHGVSVVIVRVPKRESGREVRPQAVRDIVHRNAPRIVGLYEGEPKVASANRRGLRIRLLSEIRTLRT